MWVIKKDIIDSPFILKYWFAKCKTTFALDTETTSLSWLYLDIIGFSVCDGVQAAYIVLSSYDSKTYTHCDTKYKQELLDILEYYISESQLVIMHNAAFDMLVLKKCGIEL